MPEYNNDSSTKDLLEVIKKLEGDIREFKGKDTKVVNPSDDIKQLITDQFNQMRKEFTETQAVSGYQKELEVLGKAGITQTEILAFADNFDKKLGTSYLKDMPNTAEKVKLTHKLMLAEHLPQLLKTSTPKEATDPVVSVTQATPISTVSPKPVSQVSKEVSSAQNVANKMLSELGIKTK